MHKFVLRLRKVQTVWPSGLRRCVKAAVRKSVGSNPTAVKLILRLTSSTSMFSGATGIYAMTVWPSGLRRCVKAAVRKGVGSNPTAVTFEYLILQNDLIPDNLST